MKIKAFALIILLSLVITSCFRGWIMTDHEISQHYQHIPTKPTFHTIENDSIKLHFVSFGADTAQPVLFIHGAPGTWDGYLSILDDSILQHNFQLISVDRLGYGKSKKKGHSGIYTIENQANAINLALKINHSRKKAIVIGRSYGVPIAAKMAAKFPEKIQKLILISPAIDPDKEKFWWFSEFGKFFFVRWFLPDRMNTATDEKFAHVAELRKLTPDWQKIKSEITVVQGGKDWIIDTTNFSYAKKMLAGKNAHFYFLPQAGHLISVTNPEVVKKEILASVK